MADIKENLIKLVKEGIRHGLCSKRVGKVDDSFEAIANYLIANGVTVQQWIPVTERLPEISGNYLTRTKIGNIYVLSFSAKHKAFNAHDDSTAKWASVYAVPVTHWMPLPESPKE